jgi:hypothetical protein
VILPNFTRAGPDRLWAPVPADLRRTMLGKTLLAGILFLTAGATAQAQNYQASGFVLRNNAPFSAIIGVPGRWPNDTNQTAELSWNISNQSLSQENDRESLFLDGETQTLQLRFQYRPLSRVNIGIEIPWIYHSGGFLDNTIDTWHDIFGLSEGIRPQTPRNDLKFRYERDDSQSANLDDSTSGIGDIDLGLVVDLGSAGSIDASYLHQLTWALTFNLEAPTGDADKLTGNGHTDLAAGLRARSPLKDASRYSWWLDLGLVWPGDVDIAGLNSSGQVFYYDAALAWRAHRRLDILLQVAGNSPLYQSGLKMLGRPAAQA